MMFSEIDSELAQIKEFISSVQMTQYENVKIKEGELLHQVIELAICKLEECHSAYEDQLASLQFDCEFHISAQEQLEKQIMEMNTTNRQLVQRIQDLELRDFQADLIQQTNVETADKLKYVEGDLFILEHEKKQLIMVINNLKLKNEVLEENLARSHQFNATIQLENLLQQKQLLKQNFILAKLKKMAKQHNAPQSMCQQYFDVLKKKYQIQTCLNSTKSLEYEDEEENTQKVTYSQKPIVEIPQIGSQNSIKLHSYQKEHIPIYDRFDVSSAKKKEEAQLLSFPLLSLANINYELNKENSSQKSDNIYHSFFKLLVQSAKLNCPHFNQTVLINLDYLYPEFINQNISFNKWYFEIVKTLDDLLTKQEHRIQKS